jgi:hypothetical protein
MRRDSSGAIVTIDDHSPRAAAEIAGHVVSCLQGERPLAPVYGMPEAAMTAVSGEMVAAVVAVCEPELTVIAATVSDTGPDRVRVQVDVEWSQQ